MALHGRHIIDPADGAHLLCCWDTCERAGTMLYRVRIWEGLNIEVAQAMAKAGWPQRKIQREAAIYSWKVFCTERHKQYYINAPRDLNNLPPGYRLALT